MQRVMTFLQPSSERKILSLSLSPSPFPLPFLSFPLPRPRVVCKLSKYFITKPHAPQPVTFLTDTWYHSKSPTDLPVVINYNLLNTCYVADSIPDNLHILSDLTTTTHLLGRQRKQSQGDEENSSTLFKQQAIVSRYLLRCSLTLSCLRKKENPDLFLGLYFKHLGKSEKWFGKGLQPSNLKEEDKAWNYFWQMTLKLAQTLSETKQS